MAETRSNIGHRTDYAPASMQAAISRYRWTICALVFFATTINYLDRAVISLLKSDLEKTFRWTETDYANIVVAFQLSYALGMVFAGRLIDRLGTKAGYAISIVMWSVAAIGHSLVRSTFGFIVARSALGVSEAGNFPSAIKTVAEWFPKKERALATGIFNSGTNIGALLAPLTVPLIAQKFGWQWAFIITGALGFIWLVCWLLLYEIPSRHKKLTLTEFEYIHSDHDETQENNNEKQTQKDSWFRLLSFRQTWALILGKFLTDPVWWFYLFWLPAFLKAQYGITGTGVMFPVALVYTLSSAGSVCGGWVPLIFIRKGVTVFVARKRAMLIYACCALPVIFAQYLGSLNMWFAVLTIGFAAAAHQAWSANIFTTASDMFPKRKVASVTGLGGMAGALGGMAIARFAGVLFDHYKAAGHLETGYMIMFAICGCAYLLAWILMQLLVPNFRKID